MWKWLKRLFYGDDCNHEWSQLGPQVQTEFSVRVTLVCKKCGRITKRRL